MERQAGFRRPALALVAAVVGYVAIEQSVFGPLGFYRSFLEPESLAGSVELLLQDERSQVQSGVPEIAVMGNSQIGEGFSAKTADREARGRLRFSNLSVPGTSLRCWYYLLRAVDPAARRFSAIVVPLDYFSDEDGEVPMADRMLDLQIIVALLGPRDIWDFASSFHSHALGLEAARDILLKGYIFKYDFQAFIESPRRRLEKVEMYHKNHAAWIYDYPGRRESLSGLRVDWIGKRLSVPPSVAAPIARQLQATLFRKRSPQTGAQRAYRRLWMDRILGLYKHSGARIIFLRIPRGPAVNSDADRTSDPSTPRDLASNPAVRLIDRSKFEALEVPECFWDELHMNSTGRERFSVLLAQEVMSIVRGD